MEQALNWLISGPSWVEYRTRLDLLDQKETDQAVQAARREMLSDPLIRGLLQDVSDWPGQPINSHKKADLPMHKLAFLADLGLTAADPELSPVIEKILSSQSDSGPFLVKMVIPTHFGGSGKEILAWALCDAPTTLYSLLKFGLSSRPQVQLAVQAHLEMIRSNGYPCLGSTELGTFRGPGRKEDPCPYATLVMLKVLSEIQNDETLPTAQIAVTTLINAWNKRETYHPYMFYMGTDFEKIKAPLNWYDLLHLCEVLTRFQQVRTHPAVIQMVEILKSKLNPEGMVTAESVYLSWKDWEFGQKKEPSRWLTFLVHRILRRMDGTV